MLGAWPGSRPGGRGRRGRGVIEMWQSSLAVLSLLPTALQLVRRGAARDRWFWLSLLVGLGGPLVWAVAHAAGRWQMGFSQSLWASAAATMLVFGIAAVTSRAAWRLAGLLGTYLIGVTLLALLWQAHGPLPAATAAVHAGWMKAHILVALTTYGLVTLAAVAAFAAVLQSAALKGRRRTDFAGQLPSLADCDLLQVRFLQWG